MSEAAQGNTSDATAPLSTHIDPAPKEIPLLDGSLRGFLSLPTDPSALIVMAHAGKIPEAHDEALAETLRQEGMATLVIDLLTHQEERFADVHNNVPLLSKRLLGCLTQIKRQMQNGELPTLSIGLCTADSTSPVAIRVAALRDHDIAAIACRGGLIDLAGGLYLRSLESPLLVLLGEHDETLLASNQRALKQVACNKILDVIPDTDSTFASTIALAAIAQKISHWFIQHCHLN